MGRSGWRRFGYACVNFGAPVSMREYCAQHGIDFHKLDAGERKRAIGEFGGHLMAAVRVVPVLPVPLVAAVILGHGRAGLSELELKAQVNALIERLEAAGAHTYIPRKDLDYAVGVGLRMLTLRPSGRGKGRSVHDASGRAALAWLLRQLDRSLPAAGRLRPAARSRRGIDDGRNKVRGAGQVSRGSLSKPPRIARSPGAAGRLASPGGWRPSLHQARDSVGHWRASAAATRNSC